MSFQSSLENVPGFEEYMQRYPQFAQSMHYRNSQYDRDIVVQFPGNVQAPPGMATPAAGATQAPSAPFLYLAPAVAAPSANNGQVRATVLQATAPNTGLPSPPLSGSVGVSPIQAQPTGAALPSNTLNTPPDSPPQQQKPYNRPGPKKGSHNRSKEEIEADRKRKEPFIGTGAGRRKGCLNKKTLIRLEKERIEKAGLKDQRPLPSLSPTQSTLSTSPVVTHGPNSPLNPGVTAPSLPPGYQRSQKDNYTVDSAIGLHIRPKQSSRHQGSQPQIDQHNFFDLETGLPLGNGDFDSRRYDHEVVQRNQYPGHSGPPQPVNLDQRFLPIYPEPPAADLPVDPNMGYEPNAFINAEGSSPENQTEGTSSGSNDSETADEEYERVRSEYLRWAEEMNESLESVNKG